MAARRRTFLFGTARTVLLGGAIQVLSACTGTTPTSPTPANVLPAVNPTSPPIAPTSPPVTPAAQTAQPTLAAGATIVPKSVATPSTKTNLLLPSYLPA